MEREIDLPPCPCPRHACSGLERRGLASSSLLRKPCCTVLVGQTPPVSTGYISSFIFYSFTFSQYMSSSSKALSVSIAARARVLMINFFGA